MIVCLAGEEGSNVFLHWDTNDAINAKIMLQSETYYIEVSLMVP